MADGQTAEGGAQQVEGGEPQGASAELDYKALYEAEKAHSRKWERQAKANREAASKLEDAQQASKTADERIADPLRDLEDERRRGWCSPEGGSMGYDSP